MDLSDYELENLWIQRANIHDGDLMPQLRDYARAVLAVAQCRDLLDKPVLSGVVTLAMEAHAHWDADRDSKVGKILLALAGCNPRYDPRADALHASLAKPCTE